MIKKLYQVLDRLELCATEGFFDDVGKKSELKKAIILLKEIIEDIQDDLK